MISVLVPTRGRVDRLHVMLSTLRATASSQENVEVVARVDFDDPATIDYLSGQNVRCVIGPRIGYAGNARMVNECAFTSKGDLLLVANDDLEFETPDWDLKLAEAASLLPDGLFDLGVDTVLNNDNFCFPCTSRRAVEVLGCFFDDRLLYPDIWLRDVMATFGRAIRVPQVVIRHRWAGPTEDQQEAGRRWRSVDYQAIYDRCLIEGREKIAAALGKVAA